MKEHDCLEHVEIIECNGDMDKCQCRICGYEWEESCSFDEDYD
jgi:NAD-dependent SIR2 family protein deacetylase